MSRAAAGEYAPPLTEDPGPWQPGALPGLARLTAREWELVTLVAQGAIDAQIARCTSASAPSVPYLDRIPDKTGRRRRADLSCLALVAGLF